jgi:hypothetical protein
MRVNFLHGFGVFPSRTPFMLSLHLGGVLGLAYPKEQAENILNRRWGLSPCCPLLLAVIGGEETGCPIAALQFSTRAFRSFFILRG